MIIWVLDTDGSALSSLENAVIYNYTTRELKVAFKPDSPPYSQKLLEEVAFGEHPELQSSSAAFLRMSPNLL